jgi:signal transduction histidine kinase
LGEGEKRTTVIEVKDSGRGFPEGDAERIFHRFEKAPDSTGSGLGLTIARAIIEAQHGTLTARSDGPTEGACFTIVLPASTLRRRE